MIAVGKIKAFNLIIIIFLYSKFIYAKILDCFSLPNCFAAGILFLPVSA